MENLLIKNTSFSEYEARIKLVTLYYSLTFEEFASDFLRIVLNQNDEAVSLGNSSKALSFNQKVQLLLDAKAFEKDDKKKIEYFMSIRNQFMHNSAAITLESCMSFLTGIDKKIEEGYWKTKRANEEAGGEKAAKELADEEQNEKELMKYDVSEREKLLYKCWINLASDVIGSFKNALTRISKQRKVLKIDSKRNIILNFPTEDT
ncbi:hypothetical protein [Ulvibacterium marinum]|uniref:Uncharacterized protein n=1 Tax=Ulvibacterium marinum TaxID=2419782 RepID=A0A3B0CEQ6_9FLAO|nr:hypothetical protein [Ulvibacterium marinum]RKN83358.1 hypothetical protein D7Z94_05910 [Ulvibacterium marinum]